MYIIEIDQARHGNIQQTAFSNFVSHVGHQCEYLGIDLYVAINREFLKEPYDATLVSTHCSLNNNNSKTHSVHFKSKSDYIQFMLRWSE